MQDLAVLAAEGGWVRAAHDVSDGGLAVALAEMMLTAPERALGIEADLGVLEADTEVALFSERPAILFEVHPERAARLFHAARERSLLAWPIGTVSAKPELRILTPDTGPVRWSLDELRDAASAPLERLWNEEDA
jgi:phosphoribosylformylglycinamidine synthase